VNAEIKVSHGASSAIMKYIVIGFSLFFVVGIALYATAFRKYRNDPDFQKWMKKRAKWGH
jgi:p-aminobenzoyl-glutamate transporter AbgT